MIQILTTKKDRGSLAIQVLIISAVAIILLSGFVLWSDIALKSAYRNTDQVLALTIAESGIEYYRWHLAHAPQDFTDGTGQPGPYVHPYQDKNGNTIGQFSLEITPPAVGSTVVTVKSTGTITANPIISKTIQVKFAVESFAKYAVVTNSDIRFGPGTEIFGPIHSNGGIHFDGLAHNIITSAKTDYNDPDHSGNVEFGVHTHVAPIDPVPPAPVPNRPDVFEAGRQFPVPAIDFAGISQNLADIKSQAQSSGRYFGPSNDDGYHIVFKTNDTFDLYKVTKILSPPNGCTQVVGQSYWGTWSIETETFLQNYAIPANGLIFVEDDLWVNGQINTARVTIGTGRFPENASNYANITVNNDLLYTNYDGQDAIGLISQGNYNAGLVSEDDLRVDAAIIAQNRRVGRHYYKPPSGNQDRCAPYHTRQVITLYGMLGSFERYGFAYTDGTGYQTRTIIYDPNLLYGPPPNFPLTADQYIQIQWTEL